MSHAGPTISHHCGEVSLCFELLEEGAQEEGGEEEDDGPEENIWDVGPVVTARCTHILPMELFTHLEDRRSIFIVMLTLINSCRTYSSGMFSFLITVVVALVFMCRTESVQKKQECNCVSVGGK